MKPDLTKAIQAARKSWHLACWEAPHTAGLEAAIAGAYPAIREIVIAELEAKNETKTTAPAPRYRLGRKLNTTIYDQSDPNGPGRLLGYGADPERAAEIVALLNREDP